MARVEATSANQAAESSLPSPPGLDEPSAASLASVEDMMQRLSGSMSHQAVLEAIREVVLHEVDARVALKSEELWAKGKQAMSQMQQAHRETTGKLNSELAACQERQRALEAENESLRQLVQGLSSRLVALGPAIMKHAGEEREESTAQGSSPSLTHDSPEPYALGTSTPRSDSIAGQPMMVASEASYSGFPCFPMPTTPVSPATPILPPSSLDAALQQRPPAFINSLAPSAPLGQGADPARVAKARFTFTLRKADGVELGLHVSHHEHDTVIRVEGIKPEGAIGAWNRQWSGSGASTEKVVMIGDKIVGVNSISNDPQRMLQECKDKQLLKIEIVRGHDSTGDQTPPEVPPTSKPVGLRADAVAFVPTSASRSCN